MKLYFLALITMAGLFSTCQAQTKKNSQKYLLIGTYTSGKSDGIYVYKFNTETGDFSQVSSAKTDNPSFITVSPN